MFLPVFETRAAKEHEYSRLACSQLIANIKSQTTEYVFDIAKANKSRNEIIKSKKEINKQV